MNANGINKVGENQEKTKFKIATYRDTNVTF